MRIVSVGIHTDCSRRRRVHSIHGWQKGLSDTHVRVHFGLNGPQTRAITLCSFHITFYKKVFTRTLLTRNIVISYILAGIYWSAGIFFQLHHFTSSFPRCEIGTWRLRYRTFVNHTLLPKHIRELDSGRALLVFMCGPSTFRSRDTSVRLTHGKQIHEPRSSMGLLQSSQRKTYFRQPRQLKMQNMAWNQENIQDVGANNWEYHRNIRAGKRCLALSSCMLILGCMYVRCGILKHKGSPQHDETNPSNRGCENETWYLLFILHICSMQCICKMLRLWTSTSGYNNNER